MGRAARVAMAVAAFVLPALLPGARAAWTATRAPLPADAAGTSPLAGLWDVSCRFATCAAAGYYTDSAGRPQVLLLTGHGSAWTAARAPLPAGAAQDSGTQVPAVASVACRSGSACVAVGDYTDPAGHLQGLVLSGYGSAWTAIQAPLPGGAAASPGAVLSHVACPSAARCVATGYYTGDTPAKITHGLVLTGHGSSWTAIRAPLPPGAGPAVSAGLWDVTCPSVTVCVGAGFYGRHGLLLTGHGSSWTATEAPLPPGAAASSQAGLYEVSCATTTVCVAAGSYNVGPHTGDGLLLTGSGSSWSATEAPLPAGAAARPDPDITGVSCGSATACVAAGYYAGPAENEQGLLLARHGSSWSARPAPLPAGAGTVSSAYLNGVSCGSATACVAAGYYADAAGNEQALLLSGHGSSWTARPAPLPAGAGTDPGAHLNGVTCPSRAACVAAGGYTDSSGHAQGLLLTRPGRPGPGRLP
jgi:hypothetical protein